MNTSENSRRNDADEARVEQESGGTFRLLQHQGADADAERSADKSLPDLVEILCADLVERWRRGERVTAESYLQLHPDLQRNVAEAFELVYSEFLVREDLGEPPSLEEFRSRFPRWAERLQRQLGLHRVLKAEDGWDDGLGDHPSESDITSTSGIIPRSPSPVPGPSIPGYEILGELGRGGMGVVYKARQTSLNRLVALKVFRDSALADTEDIRRFRREAEVAAGMRHPQIVQIYEVGQDAQHSYLALEYVEGGSLQQWLAGNPQDPRVAAALVESLGRAIQHAHERGVIHRDLKPANVLLPSPSPPTPLSHGEKRGSKKDSPLPSVGEGLGVRGILPKITDFGLAKEMGCPAGQTRTGDVLGTPGYMAPEQAGGKVNQVTPATDVYSLGAILYECLTGRPPFKGATPLATLAQVVAQEPVVPSRLQPSVPRDLETVCLKCLSKEPSRRYRSAEALADDLHRFLAGEPILARPASVWERAWKWARRRPTVAALAAALVAVTALGFALVFWQWGRAEARAESERQARHEVERLSIGLLLDQGASACEQGEVDRGLLLFARGLELAEQTNEPDLARLARLNLAAWRPHLIRLRAQLPHKGLVMQAVFSPDGTIALTGSEDRTAQLWRTDTGARIGAPMMHDLPVWCVAFGPDGKRVLTGSGSENGPGEAWLWDVATGKPLTPALKHDRKVLAVVFSPHENLFLTLSSGLARIWKPTGEPHVAPLRHGSFPVLTAIFSPDGKTVLTGGADQTARLWDADTGQARGEALTHQGRVISAAFSPDGQTFLTGTGNGVVRLWDVATRKPRGLPMIHRGPINAVAFSRDGQMVATGAIALEPDAEKGGFRVIGGEACIWDLTGRRLVIPLSHPRPVWAVAFSPDSRLLLTGCEDQMARLFRVSSGELLGRPLAHEGTVRTVGFDQEGKAALTASAGGYNSAAARLWELQPGMDGGTPFKHPGAVALTVAYSPDGRTVLTGDTNQTVRFWDLQSGKETGPILRHPDAVHLAVFGAEGRTVLTLAQDRVLRIWDHPEGRLRHTQLLTTSTHSFALTPDRQVLLTGSDDGTVHFWDAATAKKLALELHHKNRVCGLGYAADGGIVHTAALAEKGRSWDRSTGQELASWPTPDSLTRAFFGTDGLVGLAYHEARYIQIRDVSAGREGTVLSHPTQHIQHLAFSNDGRLAATVGGDRTCRLWDLPTGRPIGPPGLHLADLHGVAFRPDGRQMAVCGDAQTRLWEIPTPVAGAASQVRLWVELATGLELGAQGLVRPLSAAAQQQRREGLQGFDNPAIKPSRP